MLVGRTCWNPAVQHPCLGQVGCGFVWPSLVCGSDPRGLLHGHGAGRAVGAVA